jgi:hypothetical protein
MKERNCYIPRIELTDEIVKAITMCCPLDPTDNSENCFKYCALAGACLEYYTGDSCQNKEEHEENL